MIKINRFFVLLLISAMIHLTAFGFYSHIFLKNFSDTVKKKGIVGPIELTWETKKTINQEPLKVSHRSPTHPHNRQKQSPQSDFNQRNIKAIVQNDLFSQSLSLAGRIDQNHFNQQNAITDSFNNSNPEVLNYEKSFTEKVERIGSVNYPPPVNGRPLSGAVRLSALIQSNGELKELLILQGSGISSLDQAALNIVRLSSPFLPFTSKMKNEVGQIRIVRTFVFRHVNESVTSQ